MSLVSILLVVRKGFVHELTSFDTSWPISIVITKHKNVLRPCSTKKCGKLVNSKITETPRLSKLCTLFPLMQFYVLPNSLSNLGRII